MCILYLDKKTDLSKCLFYVKKTYLLKNQYKLSCPKKKKNWLS